MQQQDERLAASLQGAPWLGQSIEALSDLDALLVVGANLRKEQPLLTARLRRAAKGFTRISIIGSSRETLYMPLLAQDIIHPDQWAAQLQALAADMEHAVSGSLKNGDKAAILLGAEVQNHPDYAAIYAAAQQLADATGAVLGILPQAANSVGAAVLGVDTGDSIQTMQARPKKAVLLMNVEPEMDVADGGAAVAALKQAHSVMAFTAYESDTLLDVCDVLLPIAPFTETSGSFINMEGRLQSFHGVVKGLGDSRPLWKVLRVLGNVFGLAGFDFDSSEQVLKAAVNPATLPEKLNNRSSWQGQAAPARRLVRVGGVGIYHSDAIVRRSAPLQATAHAAVPAARVHPLTLAASGLIDGDSVRISHQGHSASVVVQADDTLPENVVHLPLHSANAAAGGLMNSVELGGA